MTHVNATWDMTHSNVGHDSLLRGTCLIRIFDVTHSYVKRGSLVRATCRTRTCSMTHSNVGHDSHISAPIASAARSATPPAAAASAPALCPAISSFPAFFRFPDISRFPAIFTRCDEAEDDAAEDVREGVGGQLEEDSSSLNMVRRIVCTEPFLSGSKFRCEGLGVRV